MTAKELRDKNPRGPLYNQIFREYIRSGGERMQLYRLFYYSSRKAPVATALAKRTKFGDTRCSVEERFVVADEELDAFVQAGKSIERMCEQAKKLCNLLARVYGFRVNELVVDFVRDKRDVYWLTNIRYFSLEPSNYTLKKLEHQKLIQSQATALEQLRQQASDSSNSSRANSPVQTLRTAVQP